MASDGISRLIAVTQLKAANANDQALAAAQKQGELIGKQKSLHGVQSKFTELTRTQQQSAVAELQQKLAVFRTTLSHPAAALLDQWLEWAAQHH
jgi:Neuraminidase (sialidase)